MNIEVSRHNKLLGQIDTEMGKVESMLSTVIQKTNQVLDASTGDSFQTLILLMIFTIFILLVVLLW